MTMTSEQPIRCKVQGCGNTARGVSAYCGDHWMEVVVRYRCNHDGSYARSPEVATIEHQVWLRKQASLSDCQECALDHWRKTTVPSLPVPDQVVPVYQSIVVELRDYILLAETSRIAGIDPGIEAHMNGSRLTIQGLVAGADANVTLAFEDSMTGDEVDMLVHVVVTAPTEDAFAAFRREAEVAMANFRDATQAYEQDIKALFARLTNRVMRDGVPAADFRTLDRPQSEQIEERLAMACECQLCQEMPDAQRVEFCRVCPQCNNSASISFQAVPRYD